MEAVLKKSCSKLKTQKLTALKYLKKTKKQQG